MRLLKWSALFLLALMLALAIEFPLAAAFLILSHVAAGLYAHRRIFGRGVRLYSGTLAESATAVVFIISGYAALIVSLHKGSLLRLRQEL